RRKKASLLAPRRLERKKELQKKRQLLRKKKSRRSNLDCGSQIADCGLSGCGRKNSTDSLDCRLGKSRPGIRRDAPQRRIPRGRSSGRTIWISMGKIDKVGRGLSAMRRSVFAQADEFHESKRSSSFRSRAILQNRTRGNSGCTR